MMKGFGIWKWIGISTPIIIGIGYYLFFSDNKNDQSKLKQKLLKPSIDVTLSGWKGKVKKKLETIKRIKNMEQKLLKLDTILEFALIKKYGQKKSIGEILNEKGKSYFSNNLLERVWKAHQMRNKLA